jgi:hypothetical protein
MVKAADALPSLIVFLLLPQLAVYIPGLFPHRVNRRDA